MPIILRHRYFAFNNGTIEPVLGFMAGIGMSWLHHWSRALSAITVLPARLVGMRRRSPSCASALA